VYSKTINAKKNSVWVLKLDIKINKNLFKNKIKQKNVVLNFCFVCVFLMAEREEEEEGFSWKSIKVLLQKPI
jgi:hypothetical protein